MRICTFLMAVAVAGTAACSAKQVDPVPVGIENDQVISDGRDEARRAGARAAMAREQAAAARDSAMVEALASCDGLTCEGLANGVATPGMNHAQILAVTGTGPNAWRTREAAGFAVMHPADLESVPADNAGAVALVQFRDGVAASITYRTPQGMHVVSSPKAATREARAAARADLLIREGDDYAAAGDFDRALDRYDRAQILSDAPLLDYKIATVLDQQLRPIEALMRYQLFLHQMELERIEARGIAAGHLAEAIARARERVMIIERNR